MTILDGLAAWLGEQQHGVYATDRPYEPDEIAILIGRSPSQPDRVVVVTTYQTTESDALLGYDEPHIQVRVRGRRTDTAATFARAQAIYDDWHGLGPVTLPTGHQVISVIGTRSGPIPIGADENGRMEYTTNFRVEYRRDISHRQ